MSVSINWPGIQGSQRSQRSQGDELDSLKYLSLEFLLLYVIRKGITDIDILMLLLKKVPSDVDGLLEGIRKNNTESIKSILKQGPIREALPTENYYKEILNATIKETDKTQAEHLLRYLLFSPLNSKYPEALKKLIEAYDTATPEEKKYIISPYCWTATTIFIDGHPNQPLNKSQNPTVNQVSSLITSATTKRLPGVIQSSQQQQVVV